MGKLIKDFKKNIYYSIGCLGLFLILGLFLFIKTEVATKLLTVLVGSLIFIDGLTALVRYFGSSHISRFFYIDLIYAVLFIIFGLFTIFNPFATTKALGVLFGIWLILSNLEKLYYGIVFFKHQEEIAPLVIFMAILLIVSGILSIINPFESFMVINKVIGLFIICNAVLSIMYFMLFRRRCKNIVKLFDK